MLRNVMDPQCLFFFFFYCCTLDKPVAVFPPQGMNATINRTKSTLTGTAAIQRIWHT